MLKNRYYIVVINDETNSKLYLRTKIDLYTEGVSLYDGLILQGYNLKLRVYKNNGKYELNGISLSNGKVTESEYLDLDEMGIFSSKETDYTYTIAEVTSEEEIKKINSIINNSIRNFVGEEKTIFDTVRNNRPKSFKYFKEFLFSPMCKIGVGEYIPFDQSGLTMEEFHQMEDYVKSLNNHHEVKQKGRDSNGNKIRKRKRK